MPTLLVFYSILSVTFTRVVQAMKMRKEEIIAHDA
jgi:hypothetical protein